MKLKTSCFEPAISHAYRKRFAPLCALYTIGVAVITIGSLNQQQSYGTAVTTISELCQTMCFVNLAYAVVAAQLLTGDLYTPRLSYAIHALPITMGGWFGTQVILGILSILPGILLSGGVMLAMLTRFRFTAVVWMGYALFSFLFFYGAALLSSVCAGNRVGMLLLYGIINFGGYFFRWAKVHIFGSLIYGLYIPHSDMKSVPLQGMILDMSFSYNSVSGSGYEALEAEGYSTKEIFYGSLLYDSVGATDGVWIVLLYALLGCALVALAAYLLHKRKPESAGDLLAFRVTKPVILVISALFCGIVANVIFYYMGFEMDYPLLFVGIVLGYYAALMLMKRQVNVFTLKSLPSLLIMLAVVLASLVATGLDVFGTTYKVPQADEVAQVTVVCQSIATDDLVFTEQDDIAEVIALQQECLDEHRQTEEARPLLERIFGDEEDYVEHILSDGTAESAGTVHLCYTMTDGSTLYRSYTVYASYDSLEILRRGYSAPKYLFSAMFRDANDELDKEALMKYLRSSDLYHYDTDEEGMYTVSTAAIDSADLSGLVDALLADCADYTTAQTSLLHNGNYSSDRLTIYMKLPISEYFGSTSICIYPDCTNTIAFLESHGYYDALTVRSYY